MGDDRGCLRVRQWRDVIGEVRRTSQVQELGGLMLGVRRREAEAGTKSPAAYKATTEAAIGAC